MRIQSVLLNLVPALILFFSVSFSNASDVETTRVKVVKSRAGKSLIIYNINNTLKPGVYNLTTVPKEDALDASLNAAKDHFVSLSLDASLLSQKTTPTGGTASTPIDVKSMASSLTYGWNKLTWEWGVFLSYSFNTVAALDTKTLVGGLLFDKNFTPNTLESEYVFGFRLQGGVGQEDSTTYTKAAQVTVVQPALYLKWFGLNPNVGLTTELGYRIQESKTDEAKTQTQGTYLRLGVASYF